MENVEILRHEFIGKMVAGRSVSGTVIDETKSSFLVRTANGRKRLLKHGLVFTVSTAKGDFTVKGNDILMKPEDRVKIKQKARG